MGKSTIFNRLLENERALVTDIPGTTRDSLVGQLEIEGLPVQLIDTAGIRNSKDPIEQLGIERTRKELRTANIVLHVKEHQISNRVSEELHDQTGLEVKLIEIINKSDLRNETPRMWKEGDGWLVSMSARNDKDIALLREAIFKAIGSGEIEDTTFMAENLVRLVLSCGLFSRVNSVKKYTKFNFSRHSA